MKESYSSNEVSTLLESLRSEFRSVAEVVLPLREDMADVKTRLSAVETELVALRDVVRVAIPFHERRITKLESKIFEN